MPAVVLRLEQNVLAAATRTGNAIGPTMRYEVFAAIVGTREVENRFLKGFRFLLFDASILAGNR